MFYLKTLARKTLDTLLPPRCPGTGEIVDAPGMISAAFWPELAFIEAPFCKGCGLPFAFEVGDDALCGACIERAPLFEAARSAVVYNDASRRLVLGFKYGDRLHMVHNFIPWLMRAGAGLIAESTVIVPVPLHRRRLWSRRFNQSAMVAAALGKATGKTVIPDALLRCRHTVPQKGLSRKDRAENVRNAFAVHPRHAGNITGAVVLLVDDVFTSGATLNECTRMLKKAGAARVNVLTVARVAREDI